jgi:TolB-like protein/class 3 adenylate cyclase
MTEEGFKRKLTTILSADVAEYSRLMGEDETATVKTLTSYRQVMTELIKQHRGRVIDSPGDNLLAEFTSVVDAVQCSLAVQKELQARNAGLPENRRMQFRIGINLGDVIEEEDRIYGDGVNIAARLEALAEPGGICISKTAFDQIETKLPLGYKYLGEQEVKNITKPVGAYQVSMEPRVTITEEIKREKAPPIWRRKTILAGGVAFIVLVIAALIWNFYFRPPPMEPASIEKMAFHLPDKPSIAVLPFVNMSDDPKQEYFSDGMSEDLITDLTKIPGLLVISRLSSFTYKGKSVKIQQIAEELGVRYVLEGSVRKADNNVRINAQLIDAATGHHLWAERYDGNIRDIFDLQDKITQKIAASLAVKLTEDEQDRLTQKDTTNIEAYEAFLKGSNIANSLRNDVGKFVESLPWFEKAIELDPDYSLAYAALAETYIFGSMFGIQRKLGISSRLAYMRGINYLQMAMKNPTNIAYRIAARVYTFQRLHEKALNYGMKAIALGPNEYRSNAFMATILLFAGRPDEAVAFTERMRRADPACLW